MEDYVGGLEKLGDLERKIDEVAGTKRWVSIDPPSLHEEYLRGWNVRGPEAQTLLCQAAQAGDAEPMYMPETMMDRSALKHARFGLTSNDNSPFASEQVPDYRSKFKIIEGLLRAAGASGEHIETE